MWIDPNPAGTDPEPAPVSETAPMSAASSGAVINLGRAESMRLLAAASHGRVVFTRDALPAIRLVRHIVREDRIIVLVRLSARSTVSAGTRDRVVVAYEADDLDPNGLAGWAVVVTGLAHPVTDPELLARYERVLRSSLDRVEDMVFTIEPTIVTGMRVSGPR